MSQRGTVIEMTEKEKMLSGELYDPMDAELVALRTSAHELCTDYNGTYESDGEKRKEILAKLLPTCASSIYFQGPIQIDYGCFLTMGEGGFVNFNFTVLDCAPVTIGKNVFIGPNVSLYTAIHPLRWQERNFFTRDDGTVTDLEYAKPITIKDNCWIAGNVTVCGGVTIGAGTVIGAGSVVTRDIPEGVLAAGNPCRVLRKITEEDTMDRP